MGTVHDEGLADFCLDDSTVPEEKAVMGGVWPARSTIETSAPAASKSLNVPTLPTSMAESALHGLEGPAPRQLE